MASKLVASPAWQELQRHPKDAPALDVARVDVCEIAGEGLRLNYALSGVAPVTMDLLMKLAAQQKVEDWRGRMLRGEKINVTENRAVLHCALRQKSDQLIMVDGKDVAAEVAAVRKRITGFVDDVREGRWKGANGKPIKHVVNIGIGGSDLGPRLAARALDRYTSTVQAHFVANADAYDLQAVLETLNPEETLFVVVSKTFTTQETLLNAQNARQWVIDKLGFKAVAQHFVAVSSNLGGVEAFGIDSKNVFPMWDWVGGRFSLWSAVGLSLALTIGMKNFDDMLAGAAAMDGHFVSTPLDKNMPVVLAMLGIWQRNFCGTAAQAILPYSERLRDLPRYLQQLEMESNGKCVTRDGEAVDYATAPVIFGECGSVGQHSFHQLLHQGTDVIPADFIGIVEDDLDQPKNHLVLQSNMVAQAGALAFGQKDSANLQDIYYGGRPSNVITLDRLDPFHFGMLLALYEHKVFVQGVVWNINSFDQPGVELGKKLARQLESGNLPQGSQQGFLAGFFARLGQKSKK